MQLVSRCVGMADEADSKSVVGNHVWVQVPSPAVMKRLKSPVSMEISVFFVFMLERYNIQMPLNVLYYLSMQQFCNI